MKNHDFRDLSDLSSFPSVLILLLLLRTEDRELSDAGGVNIKQGFDVVDINW